MVNNFAVLLRGQLLQIEMARQREEKWIGLLMMAEEWSYGATCHFHYWVNRSD